MTIAEIVLFSLLAILLFPFFLNFAMRKGFVVTVEPLADAEQNKAARPWRKKHVAGIPFYKKIPVFIQTTIYLDPFLEVRLYVKNKTDAAKPAMTPIAVSLIPKPDLFDWNHFRDSLQSCLEHAPSVVNVIDSFNNELPGWYPKKESENARSAPPKMYANVVETRMVIDWENLYHINYKVPVIGSSSLSAELSAEGTLSKAVGETTDKTIETIIGAIPTLLPAKEFLAAEWDQVFAKEKVDKSKVISLQIEEKIYKYTFTRLHRTLKDYAKPIPFNRDDGYTSLEIIDAASAREGDPQDAAGKAIEFSGQVNMPE